MSNNSPIELTGNIKQQASQLFEILKERELSIEQLEKLTPNLKEFFSQFNNLLREEISSNKECNINTIKTLQAALEGLIQQIHSQTTKEEKTELLMVIIEIQKSIKDIEINRENNSNGFKKLIAFLGSFLMLVVIILTAGKVGNKNQS